ncbi:MAG: DUF1641 domain-containing protein [Thermoprotei archaeon]
MESPGSEVESKTTIRRGELVKGARPADAESKLRVIAERLNDLGILDLVVGVLEDEKQVASLISAATSDEVLTLTKQFHPAVRLMSNLNVNAAEQLLNSVTGEKARALQALLDLASALDEKGLIEPVVGFLRDDRAFFKVASRVSSEEALSFLGNSGQLLSLINFLNEPKVRSLLDSFVAVDNLPQVIGRVVELVSALDRAGLIDPLIGLLLDEKMMGAAVKLLSDDRFLELVRHSGNLFTLLLNLADMDEELLSLLTAMQTETAKKVFKAFREAGTKDPQPVKGTFALLRELGNDDVGRGMGVVFSVLRELGKQYTPATRTGD